jgi:alcohol dehydrogenase (cytochrome c)
MGNVNWTKGIAQKTGKPIDYDPNKAIQTYAGIGNLKPRRAAQEALPVPGRR